MTELKDVACTKNAHCHPPKEEYSLPELFTWSLRHDWGEGSDTYRWAPVLFALTKQCSHVTEFGVDSGISTGAILSAEPPVFHAYDIKRLECVDKFEKIIKAHNDKWGPINHQKMVQFSFHNESTLEVEIEETDLLFIDTLHTYDQLIAELKKHAIKVRKYLCFHDTRGFAMNGELPGTRGLMPAVNELLSGVDGEGDPMNAGQWRVLLHYDYGCGFTVLERMG